MKRISRKTMWRLLPVNLVAIVIIALGLLVQSPSGSADKNYVALKAAIVHGEPDAQSPSGKIEGPVSQAVAEANQELTLPGDTLAPSALPNAQQDYYLVHDYTFPGGWRELGPRYFPGTWDRGHPITGASTFNSGRVSSFAVDPTTCVSGTCQTQYLGTANGGVWKTINNGGNWIEVFDHQLSEAIGSIAVDPVNHNIVWVGTGEQNASGDTNRGNGIYRTTDGGVHWTNLGYHDFVNRSVSQIIIDPRTAGSANATLYASSFSTTVNYGETCCGSRDAPYLPMTGFRYSTDGGQTWHVSNPPPGGGDGGGPYPPYNDAAHFSGIQDMVMDPANPNVLWAGYHRMGLYRSDDDGKTWHFVKGGLPAYQSGFDRVTPAVAPSDANRLYVSYGHPDAGSNPALAATRQMFRTNNHGTSWTKLPIPQGCNGQCEYDMPVTVDPANKDIVYTGGNYNYDYEGNPTGSPCKVYPTPFPANSNCDAAVMKSSDGGMTWYDMSFNQGNAPIHPDDHVITIPTANTVFTGNDGGLFQSPDGAVDWNSLNNGVGSLQATGGATGPTGFVFVGTQDNGSLRLHNDATLQGTFTNGGDGGPTVADPFNPNISYLSYYGPQQCRDDNSTQTPYTADHAFYCGAGLPNKTWISAQWGDFFIEGRGRFYEPYTIGYKYADGTSATNEVFAGTYRIWRDVGGVAGNTATITGKGNYGGFDGNGDGDATNDPSDTGNWKPISPDFGSNVTGISVSQIDPNYVVATTQNGKIWLSKNALTKPVVAGPTCDSRQINGGYMNCHYVSGPVWTRIDKLANPPATATPNRFTTSITFAPGSKTRIYITYSGFSAAPTSNTPGHVFETKDSGAHWTRIDGTGTGFTLPDQPAHSIVVNPHNGHLYMAADFGVFISLNDGTQWERVDFGLPNVNVKKLWLDPNGTQLYANTHGRGIWITGAP